MEKVKALIHFQLGTAGIRRPQAQRVCNLLYEGLPVNKDTMERMSEEEYRSMKKEQLKAARGLVQKEVRDAKKMRRREPEPAAEGEEGEEEAEPKTPEKEAEEEETSVYIQEETTDESEAERLATMCLPRQRRAPHGADQGPQPPPVGDQPHIRSAGPAESPAGAEEEEAGTPCRGRPEGE